MISSSNSKIDPHSSSARLYSESKQSRPYLSQHITHLTELVESYEKKKHPMHEALLRCAFYCRKVAGVILRASRLEISRTNQTLRSQEHLLREGSQISFQISAFKKAISNKEGENFVRLRKEMKSLISGPSIAPLPAPAAAVVSKIWSLWVSWKIKQLPKGESLWIDATSSAVRHAMLMRVTKNQDGSFEVQFGNTGFGIGSNNNFHPSGKSGFVQTTALIENIPKSKLNARFFYTYGSLSLNSQVPYKSCLSKHARKKIRKNLSEAAKSKDHPQKRVMVNSLYITLRTLGKPTRVKNDKRFYSPAQIGGSCTASSIWTLCKTRLSAEEYEELVIDEKMRSLRRNYTAIQNGYDQSSTRKILVLDQIEALKGIYRARVQPIPEILNTIEVKLHESRGEARRVEMTPKNVKKYDLSKQLHHLQGKKNEYVIRPMRAKWKGRDDSMTANLVWKKIKHAPMIHVEKSPLNEKLLQGKGHLDSIYLLYHAIATGNQKDCEVYLDQVLKTRNQFAVVTSEDREVREFVLDQLFEMILQMSKKANTRSDTAKWYFLALLASDLMEKKPAMVSDDHDKIMSKFARQYANLDCQLALPQDNIWKKGVATLHTH